MSYFPSGINHLFILRAARVEYRIGVVDVNEDLALRLDLRQQSDRAVVAAHGDVADGSGKRRPRVSFAQLSVAPEGAIDEDDIAAVVDGKEFIGDFRQRWCVGEAKAIGFK